MGQTIAGSRLVRWVWALVFWVGAALPPASWAAGDGRAVWVWGQEGFRLLEDGAYRAEIFDFFAARRVSTVFLFTDPDVFQNRRSLLDEDVEIEVLVEEIHAQGWSVFALSGADPNFALRPHHAGAMAMAERLFAYNDRAAPEARFDGLVIDVEPWFLPEWEADVADVAGQYLEMAEEYMALKAAYGSDIPVGAATVAWFDGIEVLWEGTSRPLNEHLQDHFDYLAVLAYRDFALGQDGIVEQVQAELAYAASRGRGIIVGVETKELLGAGNTPSDLDTFFQEGELQLEKSLGLAEAEWADSPAFWQFAIHHLGSYKTWTEVPFFHARQPLGSMVYAAQEVVGQVGQAAPFIAYPVDLRRGQRLSVAVEALDGGLAPTVVVTRSADGHAQEASAGPGGTAQLIWVEALDGNHTVTVSGGGTTGPYAIRFRVNAVFEEERFGGPTNDAPGSAQALVFAPLTPMAAGPSAASQGDFNGSGRVDLADFFLFVDAFGGSGAPFDLDGSGRVDLADFFLFSARFDTAIEDFSGWSEPAQRAAVAGRLEAAGDADWYGFELAESKAVTLLLKPARGDALVFGGAVELTLYDRDGQAPYGGRTVRSETPFGQGLFAANLPAGRYGVGLSGTAGSQYELVVLGGAGFVLDPRIRQAVAAPAWVLGALEEEPIEFDFLLNANEELTVDLAAPRAAAGPGLDLAGVEVELLRLADNSSPEWVEAPRAVPLEGGEAGRRFRFKTLFRGRYVMRVLPAHQDGVFALRVQRD